MMGLYQLLILTVAILCDVTKGQEEATIEDIERLSANITQLSNQFRLLQASIDERLASVGNSEVQQVRSLMHAAHIPHLSMRSTDVLLTYVFYTTNYFCGSLRTRLASFRASFFWLRWVLKNAPDQLVTLDSSRCVFN